MDYGIAMNSRDDSLGFKKSFWKYSSKCSSECFLNFEDFTCRFLINWFLIKKTCISRSASGIAMITRTLSLLLISYSHIIYMLLSEYNYRYDFKKSPP